MKLYYVTYIYDESPSDTYEYDVKAHDSDSALALAKEELSRISPNNKFTIQSTEMVAESVGVNVNE